MCKRLFLVPFLLIFLAQAASANGTAVINEFVANHTGTDTHEYVEVFGLPGVDLSSLTILEIEGDGRSRLFSIASWHPGGMKAFCLVFHWHRTRDELTFGSVREINGQPHLLVDENQMGCLIMQAVQDVVAFVNTVFRKHHREMRDYAVWYLSSQPSEDASDYSYSDVIMRTACRLIVDCNLIAPNVQWKIVEFCNDNASSSSSSMTTADMASLMSKLHLSTGDVQDW